MHRSCGKYWFTELCKCSKCWHIWVYIIIFLKKIAFLNIRSGFNRKVWGRCEAHGSRDRFSKFKLLLESSNSILGTKYCQVFLWIDRPTLFLSEKRSVCYPSLIIMVLLSIINSGQRGVPWKESSCWFSSQLNKLSAFLKTPSYSCDQQKLYAHFPVHRREYWRLVTPGVGFNKISKVLLLH